jgi:hypothetical protein
VRQTTLLVIDTKTINQTLALGLSHNTGSIVPAAAIVPLIIRWSADRRLQSTPSWQLDHRTLATAPRTSS